jgi:hypothetical protein
MSPSRAGSTGRPPTATKLNSPLPAPANGYPFAVPVSDGTFASSFAGTEPNGALRLYIVDDSAGDAGSIAGGWSLSLSTVVAPTGVKITSILRVAGAMHLQGEGRANTVYEVRASNDLTTTFAPIGSVTTNASGDFLFIDPMNLPRRFYRLVNP